MEHVIGCALDIVTALECSMLNVLDMLLQFDQKTLAGAEVTDDLILLSLKPGQLFYQLKNWQFSSLNIRKSLSSAILEFALLLIWIFVYLLLHMRFGKDMRIYA